MNILALVDCNNFFVSCERVFDPSLRDIPVVVLSNNDGCIISRSDEAKKLGLSMDPYFKVKDFCVKNGVKVFSSNFALYGDMSARVMSVLQEFSSEVEVYSIDEAFLNLSHVPSSRLTEYGLEIKARVLKEVGINVSIGISATKTLAKIAHIVAKKNGVGVYELIDTACQDKVLENTDVEDIWGVGRKFSRTLKDLAVNNAKELRDANPTLIRKYLKLYGQKLQHELKGVSCLEIEQVQNRKKNISVSRSFSSAIFSDQELEYIVSEFSARAAVKLRKQNTVAGGIYVYIRTGHYDSEKFSENTVEYFPYATFDTNVIITAAKKALKRIYKAGYGYKKAGVILFDLQEEGAKQLSFNENNHSNKKSLFNAIDDINNKIGKNSVFFLAQGIKQTWLGRREFISKRYTTNWSELLSVR